MFSRYFIIQVWEIIKAAARVAITFCHKPIILYLFILFICLSTITICPRGSDPFYIVTYYIEWVKTSWTYSTNNSYASL